MPYRGVSCHLYQKPTPESSWPQPPAAIPIELSRTDGTRLCIHCSASALPLAAVVRAFVEGRSCCN